MRRRGAPLRVWAALAAAALLAVVAAPAAAARGASLSSAPAPVLPAAPSDAAPAAPDAAAPASAGPLGGWRPPFLSLVDLDFGLDLGALAAALMAPLLPPQLPPPPPPSAPGPQPPQRRPVTLQPYVSTAEEDTVPSYAHAAAVSSQASPQHPATPTSTPASTTDPGPSPAAPADATPLRLWLADLVLRSDDGAREALLQSLPGPPPPDLSGDDLATWLAARMLDLMDLQPPGTSPLDLAWREVVGGGQDSGGSGEGADGAAGDGAEEADDPVLDPALDSWVDEGEALEAAAEADAAAGDAPWDAAEARLYELYGTYDPVDEAADVIPDAESYYESLYSSAAKVYGPDADMYDTSYSEEYERMYELYEHYDDAEAALWLEDAAVSTPAAAAHDPAVATATSASVADPQPQLVVSRRTRHLLAPDGKPGPRRRGPEDRPPRPSEPKPANVWIPGVVRVQRDSDGDVKVRVGPLGSIVRVDTKSQAQGAGPSLPIGADLPNGLGSNLMGGGLPDGPLATAAAATLPNAGGVGPAFRAAGTASALAAETLPSTSGLVRSFGMGLDAGTDAAAVGGAGSGPGFVGDVGSGSGPGALVEAAEGRRDEGEPKRVAVSVGPGLGLVRSYSDGERSYTNVGGMVRVATGK
ncbi:hypothetical protein HYH03_006083 [Edaphochlamys debaryana]|uniref:Uncharacterized protein n=1 Tax=Edaphochlamys debaryana TaxID=47281 RepID=A0A835YDZ4_9CHLO|nr:hypothetical protein HYH03_006083 [Edaphochlamys debaryana]|eukprot:KAG2495844.1 hypothetical protein HYH03_006083 [Edaphochlamys debaryana]